ncbi:ATP-dependent RNA helicase DHX30 [Apis mellifera caucasica]|nr:ATP-dependent RNA helicase DHX30 [Apis mellifera caucasica]
MITQKNIEKLYSNPINDLTNIYILVNREFNKQCIFYTYTNLTEMKIKCIIEVTWPRKACFSSIALQKKVATKNAALQCLNWLYECNKIKGLKPILYDPQNMNNLLNSQKYLNIDLISDLKIEIQSLIDNFDNEIKSITTMPCTKNNREDNLEEIVNEKEDNLNANLLDFNQIYYNRLKNSKQKMNQNQNLPVIDYKEEILNSLQNNQVLVIKGDTGCGKSTQIPQFILDACKEQNKICNIIVVEPRRISTVSLAYRIAQERATDIAETGITIKDIRYVIDTAIKRDTQWNENKSLFNLNFNHISQANILQRKGRAGRVQSGESYHLITRSEYDKLDLYPKPEILKAPLDQAIIMCKILSDEKIYDFFNDMIDSPNKNTIISTVNTLKNLGILDDDENLTNLGKYISYISLTPKLSKAIILSCIFQCLNPIVFIVTAFSTISHSVSLDEISNIRTISKNNKLKYHKTSDHIAVLEYFNNLKKDNLFSSIFNSDTKNFNNHETIKFVQRLCIVHINELINSKMISFLCDFNYLNKNSKNNELIRAVLFSATNNLIKRNAYGYKKTYFTHQANNLIIENNDMVKLKAESVNYNQKKWPSDLLTYIDKMDYAMRYSCLISDTSMISPLSVLLFSTADVQCEKIQDSFTKKEKIIITINDIKNINFICELETADLLLKLRNILWNVVNYIIEYENRDEGNNLKSVKLFKEHLMDLILKILTESSRDIDEFDDKNKDIIEQ